MKVLEQIISVIAPHHCEKCGEAGGPICQWCWPEAFEQLPSTCYRCNKLTQDFRVCLACRSQSALLQVWVGGQYKSPLKETITGLKYERKRAYAVALSRLLDETLPYFATPPVLCWVPTTTTRKRSRGYDQAELIARELARRRSWSTAKLLARIDQTRQVGKNRRERLASPIEFRVRRSVPPNTTVLLVDDVMTTGAMLEAAAHALRAAGAAHVSAVVCATNKRRQDQ